MTDTSLTIIGLLLDICGAYFLAKGVFLKSVRLTADVAFMSNRRYAPLDQTFYKSHLLEEGCKDRFWTEVGFFALVIGFILQGLGALELSRDILNAPYYFSILAVSLGPILYFHLSKENEKFRMNVVLEMAARMLGWDRKNNRVTVIIEPETIASMAQKIHPKHFDHYPDHHERYKWIYLKLQEMNR